MKRENFGVACFRWSRVSEKKWWFLPLRGEKVQRINGHTFYDLGMKIHPLAGLPENQATEESVFALYYAREELLCFIKQIPLRVCRPAAEKVIQAIDNIIPRGLGVALKHFSDTLRNSAPSHSLFFILNGAVRDFEIVLAAELQALDTYFISPKGAYSTSDLIERAEILFPEPIRKDLPSQAIQDIREAGRCLAFDIPTGAGFHILRATETVMMQYYALIMGTPPPTRGRNWNIYIDKMRKSGKAEPKILEFLNHIREHYRNPVSHPEVNLSLDEAEILLGAATSIIRLMIIEIQKSNPPSP